MALGNGDEAASRPTPTRWADSDEKQVVLGPESAPEVYVQPGLIPASHNYSIADTKVPLSGISSAGADGSVFNGDTPISKQDQSGSKGQHLEAGAPPKKSSKKKWIWIGAVAAACVVVGAVVGGVVGSRATSGGTISPSASSPTTPASPAATAFAVRKNSRLAVTGWKSEQSDNIRLFYQDTEGRVRYSTLSSTDRGGWSRPTVLGVDAEPGTPLAACSFVARTPVSSVCDERDCQQDGELTGAQVHIELYYVDNSSTLRGQFFENSNTSPAGGSSSASINNFPMRLRNARMSCYVPYLIVQEEDDTVRALLWEEARVGARDPSKAWANQTLTSVRGSGGSGTAVVPITPQFLDSSAFLYRRSDGTLANFDVSTDGNVTGTSWAASISPEFSERIFTC